MTLLVVGSRMRILVRVVVRAGCRTALGKVTVLVDVETMSVTWDEP